MQAKLEIQDSRCRPLFRPGESMIEIYTNGPQCFFGIYDFIMTSNHGNLTFCSTCLGSDRL